MMRITGRLGLVGLAVGLLSSSAFSQQVPTIFMQIVEHNGSPPPDPTALLAAPGDEIVIDVLAKEWSPSGQKARSFDVGLNLASLFNGQRGTIGPKTGPRPCAVTAECTDIDSLSSCVGGFCTENQPDAAGVLVDRNRFSWIFFGLGNIGAVSTDEVKFGYGLTNSGQSPLYISPKYLGTFVLVVSNDACGRFDVEIEPFPSSALNDAANSDFIAAATGGACTSDADCSAEEVCLLTIDPMGSFCVTARTEGVRIRTGVCTCTGVAVDDADDFVVDPPSCAVDARQPRDPDGTNAASYNSMQIQLDCEDAAGIVLQHQTSPVFTLREVPLDKFGENEVTNVTANVPAPGWVTVEFAQRITEAAWTCVDVRIGGNLDSVCVGSLPGDSDHSLRTNSLDIEAVISCAIDPTDCDQRLCDIDRSGACTPADILRSLDVVTGGDSLGPEFLGAPVGWNGIGLSSCPEIR